MRDDSPRRVIVTGGSGFIGGALVAELAGAGYDVVVLSRNPERVTGLPAGARAAGWDAETAGGWGELADGAFGIVHLAGEPLADGRPWTAAKKRRIRDSRVESARAVLAAVAGAAVKPQVLVQASGVDYYGARGDEVVREEEPPGDSFLARVCVQWEAATAPAEDLGVRRAVARSGVVLARRGGALTKLALPFKLFVGGPLGSGRQYVSWIHLADEVAALRFLLENDEAAGPFNLTAPAPATNRELSAAVARRLGRPNLLGAPGFALHAVLGDMADMLLEGQRAVPAALERLGFRFRYRDLDAALAEALPKR